MTSSYHYSCFLFVFQTLIVEEGFLVDLSRILREPLQWDGHCHAAGTVRNLAAGSQADVSTMIFLGGEGRRGEGEGEGWMVF